MSLQFIIGSSGAGKSYFAYERVIRESMEHPERNYYIIVPEQFTMQTQKTLVEMHPGKGILNIDILSFERLAYRVFEETGGDNRKVLEDTGKSMVLQKMVQQHRKELAYLGSQMNKPGYLDEVKSLVSEFMQYDIREENLAEMKEKGIPTFVYYPKPMHLQGAFSDLGYKQGDFPHAEAACERVLSLPMHPYLEDEEIEKIATALRESL